MAPIGIIESRSARLERMLISNLRFLVPPFHAVHIPDSPSCPLRIGRMRLFTHQSFVPINNL